MHRGASLSLAFIAERRGQAGQLGAGRSALERRRTIHVEALLLSLAGELILVGGDGRPVDDRGRPALMKPPLSLASSLLQESTPCGPLQEERRSGRPAWWGRPAWYSAKNF